MSAMAAMGESVRQGRPMNRPIPIGARRSAKKPPPGFEWIRVARGSAVFVGAFAFLYLVLASGLSRQTEVSWAVPFGLLPIAFLLGLGGFGQELAGIGTPQKRDALFGGSAAIASFAVLRISGAF